MNNQLTIQLTEDEVIVAISQLTKTWVEPAFQSTILNVVTKLREALKGGTSKEELG